jgi:hypothetical protein
MFSSFGSLLDGKFKNRSFARKLATAQILAYAQMTVDALFPADKGRILAKSLKDGNLVIICDMGTDSQAVLFASAQIRDETNRRAEESVISKVVVRMQ